MPGSPLTCNSAQATVSEPPTVGDFMAMMAFPHCVGNFKKEAVTTPNADITWATARQGTAPFYVLKGIYDIPPNPRAPAANEHQASGSSLIRADGSRQVYPLESSLAIWA